MVAGTQEAVVPWSTDFEAAKRRSAEEEIPILLCFSRENCGFCMKLEEVYTSPLVNRTIATHFIPVKLHGRTSEYIKQYVVDTVPLLLVVGPDGREWHEIPVLLLVRELIPLALMGKARMLRRHGRFSDAKKVLEEALILMPETGFRPEILRHLAWFRGAVGDTEGELAARAELLERYPDSPWTALMAADIHKAPV
jgi:hypothetical protein